MFIVTRGEALTIQRWVWDLYPSDINNLETALKEPEKISE